MTEKIWRKIVSWRARALAVGQVTVIPHRINGENVAGKRLCFVGASPALTVAVPRSAGEFIMDSLKPAAPL